MRWLSQLLHKGNLALLAVTVAGGVAFEIMVLLGYMVLLAPAASIPVDAGRTVLLQIVWALITGPLILGIIIWAQKILDTWRMKIFADW